MSSSQDRQIQAGSSVPRPLPYRPTKRVSAPASVVIPISRVELGQCQGSANPLRSRPPPSRETPNGVSIPQRVLSPAPSGLPPRPSTLPPRPGGSGVNGKRLLPSEDEHTRQKKRRRSNEDVLTVAGHYNARPNIDRDARGASPIIGLKNFNNWIKSVLIAKFGRRESDEGPRVKVLDLGCGKGGDLQKWQRAGTDEYIAIDLAAVSVEQARSRWEQLRGARFQADFFALDCFTTSISDVLTSAHVERLFDVVSMQFCMHYAFESEAKVRMMLHNVTQYLRPGGVFIGTIPDALNILSRLQDLPPDQTPLSFGNSVYRITFDERDCTPRYGHRYTFFLQDAVEEVPEYVVYWDSFVELALEYGLHLTSSTDFQQIFAQEQGDPHFATLLTRMKVVDAQGETEMTVDQWEAANLYAGFAFTMA